MAQPTILNFVIWHFKEVISETILRPEDWAHEMMSININFGRDLVSDQKYP